MTQTPEQQSNAFHERLEAMRHSASSFDRIAVGMWDDLTDRRGIGDEIENCDIVVQHSLLDDWVEVARKVLTP